MGGRTIFPRVTSIALLYAVLHLLIVAPLSAQLGHLQKQEHSLKLKFEREHVKSIMFDDLVQRQQKIKALDKALKKRLPTALDQRRARGHVLQLADAQAVRIDEIEALPETTHEFYTLTTLGVEGQAPYSNFVNLVQAVNLHPRLGWCDEVIVHSVTEDPALVAFSMRCEFPYASEDSTRG